MTEEQINTYNKHLNMVSLYFRELRFWENKTQLEVSEDIGLHRNTLLRIENGKNFTIKTLFQLADFYEVKPSEILSIFD